MFLQTDIDFLLLASGYITVTEPFFTSFINDHPMPILKLAFVVRFWDVLYKRVLPWLKFVQGHRKH